MQVFFSITNCVIKIPAFDTLPSESSLTDLDIDLALFAMRAEVTVVH